MTLLSLYPGDDTPIESATWTLATTVSGVKVLPGSELSSRGSAPVKWVATNSPHEVDVTMTLCAGLKVVSLDWSSSN